MDTLGRDLSGYSVVGDELRVLFSKYGGFSNQFNQSQFLIIVKEKGNYGTDIDQLIFFDLNPLRLEATDNENRSMPIKLSFKKNYQKYSTLEGNSYVDWDIFDLDIKDANGTKIEDYYFLTSDAINDNEPANYELIFKDLDYKKPYLIDITTSKYPYIGTIDYKDMDILAKGIIRNDNDDSELIELGDVNCDGKVTILDIYHIYDYIFNNNEMPCGGFYFYWKDQTDSIMKFPVQVDFIIPDLYLYLKGDLNYRNNDTLYLAYEKKEILASDDILLNLYPLTDQKIFGIQLDLNFDTSAVEIVKVLKKTNVVVNNYQKIKGNSLLLLAFQRTQAGDLNKIFTRLRLNLKNQIEAKDILSIGNAISANAVTYSGEIIPISLIEYKPDITIENDVESSINVYPNPFSNDLNIVSNSNYDASTEVEVFNIMGKCIYSKSYLNLNHIKLNGVILPDSGIYFIAIINKNKTIIKRIIKQ